MGEERPNGEFWVRIKSIGEHTVALLLILVSIWLVRRALDGLLEGNGKLFKRVPIEWITNFAYLLALIKFLWAVIAKLRR